MELSAIHTEYMSRNLRGTPKPDMVTITKQIMAENNSIGANGAMSRATDIVRLWAIHNGHAV